MTERTKPTIFICLLIIAAVVTACNLPTEQTLTTQEKAATVVAQTLTAIVPSESNPPTTPLAVPTVTTYAPARLSVSEATNCRSGPDPAYEKLFTLQPGTQVEIAGSFLPGYWLVKNNNVTCWLYAAYATPSGSYQSVPTVTEPPTPTGAAPLSVIIQKWDYFCANNQADISISWSDIESETGYRVYRNGDLAAELAQNSTSFTETISLLSGQSVGYNIEAYNFAGTASSNVITMTCP
ncbi:MAG: SH3 domain-containing protein [Anaerolineales bacterium]|nr:SH3 domain-containing protein [Anaerolineales bacterium]